MTNSLYSQGNLVFPFPQLEKLPGQLSASPEMQHFLKQRHLALNPLLLLLVTIFALGAGCAQQQTHVQGKHISSWWESELLKSREAVTKQSGWTAVYSQ